MLLLLAPLLLLLAVFNYWPLLAVLLRSLRGDGPGWTLDNYARLLADPHFAAAAWINLRYAVGTIVVSLSLALLLALGLRRSGAFTAVLRGAIVAPMTIPLVAAAALASFVFLPGRNWLGEPDTALASVIAISVWKDTGTYMLFFLAGLAAVPDELVEAARLDGAGAFARFRDVVLPLLGPTFAFLLPVALLNALIQVDQVVLLTQGGPSGSTLLLLYYIYQQAAQNDDSGLASAATVVAVGVLLALALGLLRGLERRTHYAS